MLSALRFWWSSTRGFRLAPWRSPYIRWRLETYTGIPAGQIDLPRLLTVLRAERRQLLRFAAWLATMRRQARLR